MLPFTKRPARNQDDVISTGEIEVLKGSSSKHPKAMAPTQAPRTAMKASAFPPPPSERPRVFQRSMSDEDQTLLMASKPRFDSSRPAAAASLAKPSTPPRQMPQPNLRGLVRPRMDSEHTILRPSAPPIAAMQATPPAIPGPPRAPAMLPTPYMPFKPPVPQAAAKPTADVKSGHPAPSDPRLDPPAAVITARTRITRRPTVTWAAALMAAGVFVGLVTAVLARGDGDAIIDATAAFVDPSPHAARAGAVPAREAANDAHASNGSAAAAVGTGACTTGDMSSSPAPVAVNPPPPKTESAPIVMNKPSDDVATKPEPPKPAPVAYAAPAAPAPVHVAAAPAPQQRWSPPPAAAAPTPKPAPAPVRVAQAAPPPAPKPAAATHAASEFDSAAAADALAKAQLEASLR